MTALVPQSFGAPSKLLAGIEMENELGAGISGGFAHIGYKGKVWSIRHRGEERQLMRDDGDGPRGSIEIVVLKASPVLSKVWYEKGYAEGSDAAPDCFSNNGVTPDPASSKKQSVSCAGCPMNVFGGAKRADGTFGKGKACSDSKRLAVVPLGDIPNEMYGGPMLLRVPASSLGDVATYGDGLKKMGFHPFAVGTRVSFVPTEAYPKFVFAPIRALTDPEIEQVLALRNDVRTDRILQTENSPAAPAQADLPPPMQFEQTAPTPAPGQQAPPAPAIDFTKLSTSPAPVQQAAPVAPAPPPAPPKAKRRTAAQIAAEAAAKAPAAPAPAPAQSGFGVTSVASGTTLSLAPEPAPDAAFIDDLDAELDRLMPSQ
jgi:hypothetical protein